MSINITVNDQIASESEWTSGIANFSDLSLLQTWEYGQAAAESRSLRVQRLLFLRDGQVVAAAQALLRSIPVIGGGAVLVNRGPIWKTSSADADVLPVVLNELKKYWVDKKGMYLRVAPAVNADEVPDAAFASSGFDSVTTSQPWASARLDLSLSMDQLRSGLRPNWRASLKNAERGAIEIKTGTERELLAEVNVEYRQLLARNGYRSTVTPEFLETFQGTAPSERRLLCFTGYFSGKSLGGIALARYGNACEYLVGAVNQDGRSHNAGQLLLWTAIGWAKDAGYRWFDLGGMDPEHTPQGILYFKQGLAGQPYRYRGEVEACPPGLLGKAVRWQVERAIQSASGGKD